MPPQPEVVYFDERGVTVTDARVVTPRQTYMLRDVLSVRQGLNETPRKVATRGVVAPCVLLLLAFVGVMQGMQQHNASWVTGGVVCFLAFIPLFAVVAYRIVKGRPLYTVTLSTVGRDIVASSDYDQDFTARVVWAVQEAIAATHR